MNRTTTIYWNISLFLVVLIFHIIGVYVINIFMYILLWLIVFFLRISSIITGSNIMNTHDSGYNISLYWVPKEQILILLAIYFCYATLIALRIFIIFSNLIYAEWYCIFLTYIFMMISKGVNYSLSLLDVLIFFGELTWLPFMDFSFGVLIFFLWSS